MFSWLIVHQWKEKTRSLFWKNNLWVNILWGFLIFYFALNFLVLGFFLDDIIKNTFPNANPVEKFSELLFYYFLVDFLIRFFFQSLPVLSITPYMHFPVKRVRLFNFLLLKSSFSYFNWLPLLIIMPFLFKAIVPAYPVWFVISWLLMVDFMILTNNFVVFSLRYYFQNKVLSIAFILISVVAVFYFNYIGYLNFPETFGLLILKVASNATLLIIPAAILLFAVSISRNFVKRDAYLENIIKNSSKKYDAADRLTFLKKYGNTGNLLRLELKLIWRNKRSKMYLFISLFFLTYGLMFYTVDYYKINNYILIFTGIFLTGIFLIQYGQLLLAWESNYFDFILTRNIRAEQYFTAKYWLFIGSEIIAFILTLPYALLNKEIAFINFSLLLYNMGLSTFIVMYMATYNTTRISANKGVFFNYEGAQTIQFILMLIVIGMPMVVFMPFSLLGYPTMGFVFIGMMGFSGIVFRNQLMSKVIEQFQSRKYKIASGFRIE